MRIAFTYNCQRSAAPDEADHDTPETIAALAFGLRAGGHEVHEVDVSAPVAEVVVRLARLRPDLVFNTAVGRRGPSREAFYPQLFEELGLRYTGPDAHACTVALDQHLARLVARQAGVPTPPWRRVLVPADRALAGIELPVTVVPLFEGRSGHDRPRMVFSDGPSLTEAVERLLEAHPGGLLVEHFVRGQDVVVPLLGPGGPGAPGLLMPVAPRGASAPLTISPAAIEVVVDRARVVAAALDLRDLARLDFRLDADDGVWFLGASAQPSLEPGAPIYAAAAAIGLDSVEAVLARIVDSATRRTSLGRPAAGARPRTRVGLVYNLKRIKPQADGGQDDDAEFDAPATIDALADAIASLGHEVVRLEADVEVITRIGGADIDVAFNIAEGLRGRGREALVPAVLEMFDIPYTGSDPATLALTLDKSLAKGVVSAAGVPTARGVVLHSALGPLPDWIRYPVIAKPVAEGSSKGVTGASVVYDEAQLRALVASMLERYRQGVLVEVFLSGREFTVGLLGGPSPRVLAPLEIVFTGGDAHPVYSFAHKIEADTNVRYEAPAKVDAALGQAIHDVALRSFEALGCRDVARIDIRLDGEGVPHFIECNPLPGLTPGWSDLCIVATAAGMDYRALVGAILEPALGRLEARRRGQA